MEIDVLAGTVQPLDKTLVDKAQERFDNLIKPVGSLAKLEEMATRYAAIYGSADKNDVNYPHKTLLEWTDEPAIAAEYMQGGKPVCVLAENSQINTQTFLITAENIEEALLEGALLVKEAAGANGGQQVLAFGCADEKVPAYNLEKIAETGYEFLQQLESKTIAAMAGGILQAAALKVPVMLDGAATCLAALAAVKYNAAAKGYLFAGHVSAEPAMEELLKAIGLAAPLRLDVKVCHGEGAVLALSLLNAGIKAYKEMETFAEAGVHVEVKEFSRAEELKGKQGAK